jgi:integrase/recombinase XerD
MEKFDEDTREFLEALDPSTMRVYRVGLGAFQSFYGRPLKNFLDAVEDDLRKPRRERRRVARNTLKEFVGWLEEKDYAPKTIRAYVSAVQSLGRYYEIAISTRYVNLPASHPVSSKFPWTLEKVAEFIGMIRKPQVKPLAVTLFQSGLSVSDALALTYQDIRYEHERNVTPLCLDLARIKTDVPFMTFIGEWGASLLRKHLGGRRLRLETPLYNVSHRAIDHYFQRLGRRWVRSYKGQNPCRPHSLRAAFRTILGDAGMDQDVVEFFMGHRLPEQRRVYHSRSRDGWRELYRKYEYALTPENWKKN